MSATTLLSFAEFERLDCGADQVELLKGELIRMPPAQRRHNEAAERLFKLLDSAVERLRQANPAVALGKVHHEMGYYLSQDPLSWLQPDVSLTYPDQPGDRFYEGAPLIAFEIVSEYDSARHLQEKVAEYLDHGAAEVWAIYPVQRHAWVYRSSTQSASRETQCIHTPLLPGIEIPLAGIL